jgi:hypothetical protein
MYDNEFEINKENTIEHLNVNMKIRGNTFEQLHRATTTSIQGNMSCMYS